ncbi:pyridoxamine 5'-phosphate oxidase family protein [Janthinobacterium agaricidamnosum]|uniref:Pyridoxamine 5'-phosphate oxidase family protein n=1 Tax=Janthinobacterium agaricidamnosum NBRC 102515 = DSM 9628 TaxID=1349767 RepID=W0VER3_9BURK|nr:pyridoxamine 5'-phosphate oxidase family protein [Janthinobacterium agaricidamnosum]CDG85908.1 pyridoxamine 5'-phosphate oxidase family protein [Janthinobacterium agaricidamnosum NBRC 102515 = DSM 9628]
MNNSNSFHAGERAVQQLAGETAMADRNIGLLSDTVIAGARPFIAKQSMVALASVDAAGDVWTSLLFGKPGFLQTGDGRSILIDVAAHQRDQSDPLWDNLGRQSELGMLFIELGSRRRYRVNGTVRRLDAQGVEVAIREAYPNCPKYIQRRHLRQSGEPKLPVQVAHGTVLRGTVAGIVRLADTMFVASRHAGSGADASHRGGAAGFVKVLDDSTLRIPDFSGNSLFNTLGNFAIDPRAGLCIPDFVHGQLLQLSGSAVIRWDQDDPDNETGGTRRYWDFKVERWILRDTPQPLAWEYLDASPFNPAARS